MPGELAALAQIRGRLATFLHRLGLAGRVGEALLVAHELAANAIRHGSRGGDEVEMQAQLLGDRLCLRVVDRARGGSIPVVRAAGDKFEGGRGLLIVDRLA